MKYRISVKHKGEQMFSLAINTNKWHVFIRKLRKLVESEKYVETIGWESSIYNRFFEEK